MKTTTMKIAITMAFGLGLVSCAQLDAYKSKVLGTSNNKIQQRELKNLEGTLRNDLNTAIDFVQKKDDPYSLGMGVRRYGAVIDDVQKFEKKTSSKLKGKRVWSSEEWKNLKVKTDAWGSLTPDQIISKVKSEVKKISKIHMTACKGQEMTLLNWPNKRVSRVDVEEHRSVKCNSLTPVTEWRGLEGKARAKCKNAQIARYKSRGWEASTPRRGTASYRQLNLLNDLRVMCYKKVSGKFTTFYGKSIKKVLDK